MFEKKVTASEKKSAEKMNKKNEKKVKKSGSSLSTKVCKFFISPCF